MIQLVIIYAIIGIIIYIQIRKEASKEWINILETEENNILLLFLADLVAGCIFVVFWLPILLIVVLSMRSIK